MAQFHFSLQSVLNHRTQIEQDKQRALAGLQSQMQKQKVALADLNNSVQSDMNDLRQNRLTGKLEVSYLTGHRRYMLVLQRRATEMVQRMTLLQRQIDAAHAELVEAAKQRKILEKLRDRQKSRWIADHTRRELAELDDMTMRRAAWEQLVPQSGSTEPGIAQQLSDYRTPLNSADNHMERSS